MAKKLSYQDFFEKDLFQTPKEQAQEFLTVIKSVEDGIKQFATKTEKAAKEIKFEQAEDLEDLAKATAEADAQFKAFNETQKQRAKIQEDINKNIKTQIGSLEQLQKNVDDLKNQRKALNKAEKEGNITKEEANKQRAELNVLIKASSKALLDEQKSILRSKDAYTVLLDETNKAQLEFKRLAAQFGVNSEQAQKSLKAFQKLDDELREINESARDGRRDVGRYKDSIKEALDETNLFSDALSDLGDSQSRVIGLIQKAVTSLKALEQAEEGAAASGKKLSDVIKKSAIGLLLGLLTSIGLAFTKTREGQLKFQQTLGVIQASLGVLAGALSEFGKGLLGLGDALVSFFAGDFSEASEKAKGGVDKLTGAFDNFGERIKTNIKANNDLLKQQFQQIDATRELEREIAKLQAREELQQAIADDNTKSFAEREKAILKSIKLSEDRIKKERELAETELKFANDRIKLELREAGVLNATDEQIENIIKNRKLSGKVSEEALEKQQEAVLQQIEVENELAKIQQEQQKTIDELKQDRLERDLDILIDGFDNQKTINERLIADERKTFAERQKILDETSTLADASFESQKKVLEDLSKAGIDIDELLGLDAIALNKRIRELEQSEIIEGRTLEVVRERRTVLQDLADIQKDLDDAIIESQKAIAESNQNIEQDNLALTVELLERRLNAEGTSADQQKQIIDDLYEFRKQIIIDQAEFEKEQAEKEIKDAEERAAKLKEIEQIKNNDIVRLTKEKEDQITAINKESEEERVEFAKDIANQTLSAVKDELNRVNEARREAIENEIEEREENITKQEELASKGLDNQLAFEQKKRDEAELEKLEQAKREQQQQEALQLAEAFLQAYINELGTGGDPALAGGKALASTLTARAIAKAIVSGSAYDGTEDTGTISGAGLDGIGGRLWMLHDNEAVISKEKNQKYKGLAGAMLNDDVGNWMMNNSHLMPTLRDDEPKRTKGEVMSSLLIKQIEGLRNDINSKPIQQVDVDGLGNLIEKVHHKGMKITTKYKVNKRI